MCEINGNEIVISEAKTIDVDLLIAWWHNPDLMKDVGFANGVETNHTRLSTVLSEQEKLKPFQRKSCKYIIKLKETKKPIGELCYNEMDLFHKSCEIGIKICEISEQNKGYGYDALKAFLNYLFEEFDLNRIELTTFAENKRARALYQKLNFTENGIKRQCWRDGSGKFHDIVFMDLLRDEI